MRTKEQDQEAFIYQYELDNFKSLYLQYNQAVYKNIFKMVKDEQLAEDLLQEVFLTLWDKRASLDAEKVSGWLFVVSYNKALKALKKKVREVSVYKEQLIIQDVELEPYSNKEEAFSLRSLVIEEAIENLPKRKKDVFIMCRFEGRTTEEVASIFNISESSVKDYLKQSTGLIKKYIQSKHPELAENSLLLLAIYLSV